MSKIPITHSGISQIIVASFSINIFSIAGSRSQAVAPVANAIITINMKVILSFKICGLILSLKSRLNI